MGTRSPEGKGSGLRLRLGYYFSAPFASVGAGFWGAGALRCEGRRGSAKRGEVTGCKAPRAPRPDRMGGVARGPRARASRPRETLSPRCQGGLEGSTRAERRGPVADPTGVPFPSTPPQPEGAHARERAPDARPAMHAAKLSRYPPSTLQGFPRRRCMTPSPQDAASWPIAASSGKGRCTTPPTQVPPCDRQRGPADRRRAISRS